MPFRRPWRAAIPAFRPNAARGSTTILNAARAAQGNAAGTGHWFLSAEDLITLSGISTQQDLALVAALGLTHVERNGHHYVDGMSFAPETEQIALLQAHPDLYARGPAGPARLRIAQGRIHLGSLDCPGFALGVSRDQLADDAGEAVKAAI